MRYTLTDATQRAVTAAAAWNRSLPDAGTLGPLLLLGLLAESECRAAGMLTCHAVSAESVRQHWPDIRPAESSSPDRAAEVHLLELLSLVSQRLPDGALLAGFATEHLLLGLLLAGDETSAWLGEQGLSAADVEAEICRIYGCAAGPAAAIDFPPGDEILSVPAVEISAGRADPPSGSVLFRILDAAANRAREGLRVVEDYARFGLNDVALTAELKTLRHDLAGALAHLPAAALLASRDTPGDVGTAISTTSEALREGIDGVLAANLKRLQEALRSLEEYGKLVSPAVGPSLERLRYRSYSIEQRVQLGSRPRRLLVDARLYVLVDGRATLDEFTELLKTLIASGVDVIQLRDKSLPDAALIERGQRARELTRDSQTLFIMNDRADLALASEADGVHVGQDELPVAHARSMLGQGSLVGVSTHSLEQACQAARQAADYIGVGPVFRSGTKDFASFPGLELLREVRSHTQLPAFAIGGIDLGNVSRVLETGFRRIAVSGAVCRASDPAAAVARLRVALDAACSASQ
jgi:thiamine-phosphate pyrophosphorylase